MAQTPDAYKKFPGKWLSLFVKRSLWQGADHLLWVEGNLMSENYKRFYYKDIQALVICRSNGQNVWTILWSILLLLSGATALLVSGTPYVSSTLAAMWACFLIINLLKGPTCDVYLQTAVQFEKLTTLVRVRKAVKILDRIRTLVQGSQGLLNPSSVALDSDRRALGNDQFIKTVSPNAISEPALEPYRPLLHWALFGLVAVLGLLRGGQSVLRWEPLVAVDILGLVCTVILLIVVLVRSHQPVKGSLVATVDWLMLVFVALHGIAAYAFFIAASLRNPTISYNSWAVIKMFFEFQTADYAMVNSYIITVAAVSLVLGILGIVSMTLLGRRLQGAQ